MGCNVWYDETRTWRCRQALEAEEVERVERVRDARTGEDFHKQKLSCRYSLPGTRARLQRRIIVYRNFTTTIQTTHAAAACNISSTMGLTSTPAFFFSLSNTRTGAASFGARSAKSAGIFVRTLLLNFSFLLALYHVRSRMVIKSLQHVHRLCISH